MTAKSKIRNNLTIQQVEEVIDNIFYSININSKIRRFLDDDFLMIKVKDIAMIRVNCLKWLK